MQEWTSPYQIAAIVGICKNAGKTTILNHILAQNPRCRYGLLSTGIDGEDFDLVYNTPKPRVKLPRGTIFICDQETANASGSSLKILAQSPGSTGRKLLIAEATDYIETKITGPSSVTDQIKAAKAMQIMGAGSILIDGSLDRKSIALSDVVDHLILALGAGYGSNGAIKEELSRIVLLNSLPEDRSISKSARSRLIERQELCLLKNGKWQETELNTLIGAEQQYLETLQKHSSSSASFIPGAFTETSFVKLKPYLKSTSTQLIFRHPESIKLNLNSLKDLLKLAKVSVLIPFKINEFYLNTCSPGLSQRDAETFRHFIRESFPEIHFQDLWELQ